MTSLEAANPAATSALERTKSRREKMLFLVMRRPAFLVLAAPHLRRFRIALDARVFRVELQFAVYFPRAVGMLNHSNCVVGVCDRSVAFFIVETYYYYVYDV